MKISFKNTGHFSIEGRKQFFLPKVDQIKIKIVSPHVPEKGTS